MTPQKLKNSILQLAIQGKLVEQRPEEGTAAILYQQLKVGKQKQLREGKIVKSKPLASISEDDILFEIPECWIWIKIGDIAALVTKGTTPSGGKFSYLDSGIGFLRAENVAGHDKLDKSTLKFTDEKTHTEFLKRSILKCNDILITIAGTLGRTALVREDDLPLNANQAVSIIRLTNPEAINLLYLVYALNSPLIQKHLTGQKKITAIPNLTLEIIENCVVPLPPLAEQKRIVAKIKELLPYIDRYEQAWSKLESFNKQFPAELQKSILQMAIQGKLVVQRPEEGTGEELYRQIRAVKQKLIKAGTIRKEKPLPEITEDEKPFDIPESWKWARLNDVVSLIGDIDHKMPLTVDSGGYPYVSPIDFTANGIDYDKAKLIGKADFDHLAKKCKPERNDIIFPRYGTIGTIRKVDTDREFLVSYSCCTIKNSRDYMDHEFVFYVLQSGLMKNEINRYINKTTQPNIGLASIKKFMFPLPPLAEQKRIVSKLEKILPLCKNL